MYFLFHQHHLIQNRRQMNQTIHKKLLLHLLLAI
nr:MAG TPA: hypothetical protein [Bacteriophage sp.]